MGRRIAVLGGGATGVTVAHELASRGAQVDLYERDSILGGLHRSVLYEGDAFDIGAFVFPKCHPLANLFPDLKSMFVPTASQHMSLTPAGSIDRYPMSMIGYLRTHGIAGLGLATGSLLASKFLDRSRATVAEYACYYMGRRLYRTTGLQNYIQRLYGVPDSEVGVEFAEQRLKYVRGFIAGRARQAVKRLSNGKPAAADYLLRPPQGFAYLYSEIGKRLEREGVKVLLNSRIEEIRQVDLRHQLIVDGDARLYDEVVSTLPVAITLRLARVPLQSRTEHVGLLSLFYRGDYLATGAVLHNFTFTGRWKRMILFSRFYGRSQGADYFTVEVTGNDLTAARQRELSEEFEEHTLRLGLFARRPRLLGAYFNDYAYPLFRPKHSIDVSEEFARLDARRIRCAGRQGTHQYLSSHDAMEQARAMARAMPLG